MPSNLYGPNDNYDSKNSHFFPALIRKIHNAKKNRKKFIEIWGNGKAKRELTYVDDLADACEFFLSKKTKEVLINIGSGYELKIIEIAEIIKDKINPNLKLIYKEIPEDDPLHRKPDIQKAKEGLNWEPTIGLEKGLEKTIKWFKEYLKI